MNYQFLKPHKYFLYFLACFLFVGCHRGCTVSKTIRSKSRVEKFGAEKIKLIAKLKKSKRVRLNKYSKKFESSKSWYSVVIEARSDTQSLNLHWVFPEEKSARLKDYLSKINYEASLRNGYFVVSYDNQKNFTALFQRLGDAFIVSPYQDRYLAGTALNQLPTEDQLIDDFLFKNLSISNQPALARYLKTHPLTEEQNIALFDKLTQLGDFTAKKYFASIDICDLRKYVQFREHAVSKGIALLKENQFIVSNWKIYEKALLCLANEQELKEADQLAFTAFQGRRGDDYKNYILQRLKDENIPVAAQLVNQTLGKAKESIQHEISGSKKYLRDQMPFQESVALIASLETEEELLNQAVEYMIYSYRNGYNRYEKFLDEHYEYFSPESQELFIQEMKKRFNEEIAETSPIKAAHYYNYLNGRVGCNEIKEIYQKYHSKHSTEVFLDKKPQC